MSAHREPTRRPRTRIDAVSGALAAVAAAGLAVGATAAAQAPTPAVEPPPTETVVVEPVPAPAGSQLAENPAPAAPTSAPTPPPTTSAPPFVVPDSNPIPAPVAPTPPAPIAVPEVTATGEQPASPGSLVPEALATDALRQERARQLARRARDRDERRTAATARRLARTRAATGARASTDLEAPDTVTALPGLAVGEPAPGFVIERFRIPPFLLSIYQAAGVQYGVRWEILAAINEIETDYGRNLNVSSAGAQGWMQFMPATWRQYGTDANDDGRRDPYNPVDAIFAAARYLKAAGYERDVRGAIFAYNHADWYVNSVLARAKLIVLLPGELVGSLTGLTEGRFPVAARASYVARATPDALGRRGKRRTLASQGSALRRELDVLAAPGAPVVAVQDGTVTRIGRSSRLGHFLQLRDVYGNTYTYAELGSVAKTFLTPKAGIERGTVGKAAAGQIGPRPGAVVATVAAVSWRQALRPSWPLLRRRALPAVRITPNPATTRSRPAVTVYSPYQRRLLGGLKRKDVQSRRLRVGAAVVGGTVLGRVGESREPHLRFRIRPAGEGTPLIDPTPILDGWRLLDSSAVYRSIGRSALRDGGVGVGRVLLESKDRLVRRVLASPDIQLYACGRTDVAAGRIDRRVLATLAFLAEEGLEPTVTSLRCGREGGLTASGNVSEHTTGTAVDIAAINGVPILGHQGSGSVTEQAVRKLLTLQGTLKPHQIISLLSVPGTDNTLALLDHADHIHVGWTPTPAATRGGTDEPATLGGALRGSDWDRLVDRLNVIENPLVSERDRHVSGPPPGPRR